MGNDIAKSYDRRLIKAADRIAKALGVKLEFVNTLENGTVNGSIKNGYIQIAKDAYHENMTAENIAAVVVGHEITHRMQELAPIEYAKYRNYVVENNPKLVNDVANAYRAAGYAITYGSADGGARFSRKIDGNSKIGYNNKKGSIYDEYSTNAMIWANSSSTQKGDVTILNDKGNRFVLIEATADGYIELRSGKYEEVRAEYERAYRKTTDEIYGNSKGIRADQGSDIWNMQYAGYGRDDGGNGEQTGVKGLQADSSGNDEHLRSGNQGKSVKYSIKETSGAESGRTIFWEEIVDEAAAEYTGYILKSPESLNQFIDDFKNGRLGETAEQNMGVFKQLWQAIKDFISNVKKVFKGDKKAQDKAAKDTFGMPMSELEKARDLLGAAFAESERVVRGKNDPSMTDKTIPQSAEPTAPFTQGSHDPSQSAKQTAQTIPPSPDGATSLYTREADDRTFDSAQDDKLGEASKKTPSVGRADSSLKDGAEGKRYSIKYTTDNKAVVIIENDILQNVSESEWVKAVKSEIKKFSDGIPVSGRLIKVIKRTGEEYTNSGYSRKIKRKDSQKYIDKLKASGQLDEIVLASTNYVNEDLSHERKDNIKEFARGEVLLQVGTNRYSADVIIGFTAGENMVLHDVVNLEKTDIEYKKENNSEDGKTFETNPIRQELSSKDNVPQKNGSVNTQSMQKSGNNSGKKYSIKWKPDLRVSELNTLKRIIKDDVQNSVNNITEIANWLSTRINGQKVFAIYSTEDTNDPTLLYESKGKQAEFEQKALELIMEDYEYGRSNDEQSEIINTVSSGGWLRQGSSVQNSAGPLGRGSGNRNAGVLQGQPKSKSSRAFRSVIENLFKIQGTDRSNSGSVERGAGRGVTKTSLKMDDVLKQNAMLKKINSQLNKSYLELKNGKKIADTKRIASVVKNLLDENGFLYNSERLTEQFEGLTAEAQAIFEGKMDFETFSGKVREVARAVIDEGTRYDSVAYQESKKVRDYLRTTAISLGAEDKANLGDEYETIRKGTFGRLRLVKEGGTPIDVAYQEMSELFPEYFSTETEIGASAQLRQIVDVLDGLRELKTDPFGGYAEEAADWLSGMMIDRIFNEVFVSGDTGKVNVSVDMKALRESMGDNLQSIMNRERTWRTKEYDKLQRQFEKKTKNYTESRQKAIKIKQVKLHTERISKALVNPSERFAVPEDLKKPVAEFLQCIDLTSDRMNDKTREHLSDLMAAYKAMAEQEYELNMVIDPDLYNNLQEISESIKALETKDKRLSDLPLVTLEKMRNAVMAMEASLRNYNRAFREGKAVQIDALAEKAVAEIKELRKDNKKNSKIWGGASDLMNFDMLNPWDYFHQMGDTFEELYMGLRDGENVQIRDLTLAKNNLDKKMKEFGVEPGTISGKKAKTQTFKLANGEAVELTKAQIMSLHLLWRQNASHEHILEGGFRPAEVQQKLIEKKGEGTKLVTKVSEDYSSVRPSLDDVAKILKTLSESEKRFAESISQFFTEECAEWGNEVAMKLYGYKKFNTPNYFPIVSDKMYLQEDFGVSADSTIKNTGFTKKRVKHANNPVIVEDIFEVYARHTSDMAKYHGYVLPLQDIQRVFNHVSRGDFVDTTAVSYADSSLIEGAKSEGFISSEDVKIIQDIGRKSVNSFTAEDFKKTEKLAERYFKEMGKKSPFYRAEYGDWRENDNTVVETIHLQDNQDDVRGVIINKDTSREINVSKIGIDHIKVHLHNSELSSFVTKNLKEIAEKSILLDSFVSEATGKTKHKNSVMLHRFYVPIEFKWKKSVAKLYVEEFFNDWNKSVL